MDFKGQWHTLPDAGILPLPVQRPIPVWFGGHAEPVLRRTARLGDGWMPNYHDPAEAKPTLELLDRCLEEVGRSRQQIGIEPRLSYGAGDPKTWETLLRGWQAEGATHLSFNTMGSGFKTPQEHIQAIRQFAAFAL